MSLSALLKYGQVGLLIELTRDVQQIEIAHARTTKVSEDEIAAKVRGHQDEINWITTLSQRVQQNTYVPVASDNDRVEKWFDKHSEVNEQFLTLSRFMTLLDDTQQNPDIVNQWFSNLFQSSQNSQIQTILEYLQNKERQLSEASIKTRDEIFDKIISNKYDADNKLLKKRFLVNYAKELAQFFLHPNSDTNLLLQIFNSSKWLLSTKPIKLPIDILGRSTDCPLLNDALADYKLIYGTKFNQFFTSEDADTQKAAYAWLLPASKAFDISKWVKDLGALTPAKLLDVLNKSLNNSLTKEQQEKLVNDIVNYQYAYTTLQRQLSQGEKIDDKGFLVAYINLIMHFNALHREQRNNAISANGFSFITEADIPDSIIQRFINGVKTFLQFSFNPTEENQRIFMRSRHAKPLADYYGFNSEFVRDFDRYIINGSVELYNNNTLLKVAELEAEFNQTVATENVPSDFAFAHFTLKKLSNRLEVQRFLTYLLYQGHNKGDFDIIFSAFTINGKQFALSLNDRFFKIQVLEKKIIYHYTAMAHTFSIGLPGVDQIALENSEGPKILASIVYEINFPTSDNNNLPCVKFKSIKIATIHFNYAHTTNYQLRVLPGYLADNDRSRLTSDLLFDYNKQMAKYLGLFFTPIELTKKFELRSSWGKRVHTSDLFSAPHLELTNNHYLMALNIEIENAYGPTGSWERLGNFIITFLNNDTHASVTQKNYLAQIGYGLLLEIIFAKACDHKHANAKFTINDYQKIKEACDLLLNDFCHPPINHRLIDLLKKLQIEYKIFFNHTQLSLMCSAVEAAERKNNNLNYFDSLICDLHDPDHSQIATRFTRSPIFQNLPPQTCQFIKMILTSSHRSTVQIAIEMINFSHDSAKDNKDDHLMLGEKGVQLLSMIIKRATNACHRRGHNASVELDQAFIILCHCIFAVINYPIFNTNSKIKSQIENLIEKLSLPTPLVKFIKNLLNKPVFQSGDLFPAIQIERLVQEQLAILAQEQLYILAQPQQPEPSERRPEFEVTKNRYLLFKEIVANPLFEINKAKLLAPLNLTASTGCIPQKQINIAIENLYAILNVYFTYYTELINPNFNEKSRCMHDIDQTIVNTIPALKLQHEIQEFILDMLNPQRTGITVVQEALQFPESRPELKWWRLQLRRELGYNLMSRVIEQTCEDIGIKSPMLTLAYTTKYIIQIMTICNSIISTHCDDTSATRMLSRQLNNLRNALLMHLSACLSHQNVTSDAVVLRYIIDQDRNYFINAFTLDYSNNTVINLLNLYKPTDELPRIHLRNIIIIAFRNTAWRAVILNLLHTDEPNGDAKVRAVALIKETFNNEFIVNLLLDNNIAGGLTPDDIVKLIKNQPVLIREVLEGGGVGGNFPLVGKYRFNHIRLKLQAQQITVLMDELNKHNPEVAKVLATTLLTPTKSDRLVRYLSPDLKAKIGSDSQTKRRLSEIASAGVSPAQLAAANISGHQQAPAASPTVATGSASVGPGVASGSAAASPAVKPLQPRELFPSPAGAGPGLQYGETLTDLRYSQERSATPSPRSLEADKTTRQLDASSNNAVAQIAASAASVVSQQPSLGGAVLGETLQKDNHNKVGGADRAVTIGDPATAIVVTSGKRNGL